MRHIHVHVTQKDIEEGIRGGPHSCPVALAIVRRLEPTDPGIVPSVLPSQVYLDRRLDSGTLVQDDKGVPLPARVREWIKAFDDGNPVAPISFTIQAQP